MNAWKQIARLFVVAFLVQCLCGCGNDAAESETAISGDSLLLVVNNARSDVRVLFDHEYIGLVGPLESRSWEVPSGRHQVSVGGNGEDIDFESGLTLTVVFQPDTASGGKTVRF